VRLRRPYPLKRKRPDSIDRVDTPALLFRSEKRGTRHFRENTLTDNEIQRQATHPPKFICDILEKLQQAIVGRQVWVWSSDTSRSVYNRRMWGLTLAMGLPLANVTTTILSP